MGSRGDAPYGINAKTRPGKPSEERAEGALNVSSERPAANATGTTHLATVLEAQAGRPFEFDGKLCRLVPMQTQERRYEIP